MQIRPLASASAAGDPALAGLSPMMTGDHALPRRNLISPDVPCGNIGLTQATTPHRVFDPGPKETEILVKAVFIHIPKTAGTSFRAMLEEGFGKDAVSPPFSAYRMTSDDAAHLRQYDVVSGHISNTDIKRYFPEAKAFTILRSPIDRCLSWYYYARTICEDHHSDVAAAQAHDVERFFDLKINVIFRNIYNRQVRQLGDHVLNTDVNFERAFAVAKEVLQECCWVGRQETLESDILELIEIFPELSDIELPRVNVTSGRKIIDDVPARTLDAIMSLNEWDSRLLETL